jgi:hypothetical protein
MKWIAFLFLALNLLLSSGHAVAQAPSAYRTVVTESWVEEWDPHTQGWVRVDDKPPARSKPIYQPLFYTPAQWTHVPSFQEDRSYQATRFTYAPRSAAPQAPVAQYGPFLVMDRTRAAIVGSTGSQTPAQFDAMLRDYPELAVLEMIEAPGTSNDIANLEVGRRIRAAGLTTHVPRGGSVRSGAVELFLAGAERRIDPGAQFAVHSWLDNYGRQPGDFAEDDPANRLYLDYYQEMGMSAQRARDFYAMTNSVPHESALWLRAEDMRRWIVPEVLAISTTLDAEPLEMPLEPLDLPLPVIAPYPAPQIAYAFFGPTSLASLDEVQLQPFLDS